MTEYEGRALTVKDWFFQKKVKELGFRSRVISFQIFGILKETAKAIYAIVDFGPSHGYRTFWIPKSVVIDDDYSELGSELAECHQVRLNRNGDVDYAYQAITGELKDIYAMCR